MTNWFRSRPKLSLFLGILAGIILLLLILSLKPFSLKETFFFDPASTYEEAQARIEAVQVEEAGLDLHPECLTQLQTHGEKTEAVVVLLHGFTSCPAQFTELGKEFYDRGYNVYIPRTPRHGFKNRRGEPLKGLTAEELAAFAHQTADIAQGLGERVIVSGISGGGAMATYLSQEREDIEIAAPISPFLGIGFIPRPLNRPFANLFLIAPDFWQWWDPIHKENNPFSAPYAYARYPLHALLEIMRLGYATGADAKHVRPKAEKIIVITNANDDSVNNGVIAEFEQMWRDHGDDMLVNFQFEKSQGLPHDLITPTRPGARIDLVYPKLLELIQIDSKVEGSSVMATENQANPKSVADLEAAYGASRQAAFGSAVFYEKLKTTDDLKQAALEKCHYFTGELWERYGEEAWMGPWKEVYARTSGARHDIVAELRDI
jgi:pimeloyl-ACP methyl ester carboxylesterase